MLSRESLCQRFSVCIPLNVTTLVAAGDLARKGLCADSGTAAQGGCRAHM